MQEAVGQNYTAFVPDMECDFFKTRVASLDSEVVEFVKIIFWAGYISALSWALLDFTLAFPFWHYEMLELYSTKRMTSFPPRVDQIFTSSCSFFLLD